MPTTIKSAVSHQTPLVKAVQLALLVGAGSAQAVTFTVSNNNDAGAGSLRDAIAQANATPGPDVINFNPGLGPIVLTGGQLEFTEALTINGPAALDAGGNSRVLAGTALGEPLTLTNVTVTGGLAPLGTDGSCNAVTGAAGGGICLLGELSLVDSTVSGNSTQADDAGMGGGVFVYGNATVTNSTISGNHTMGDYGAGGGITVFGDLSLHNSTVSDNFTQGAYSVGGGIAVTGNAVISGSSITLNQTQGNYSRGGGMLVNGLVLTNSTVSGNHTGGNYSFAGGVLSLPYSYAGTYLQNSTIANNSTGGVYSPVAGIATQRLVAVDSTISGNTTYTDESHVGGVYALEVALSNTTVSNNRTLGANAFGGGVTAAKAVVKNSTITGNIASLSSGGITTTRYSYYGTGITIDSSILAANTGPDGNIGLRPPSVPTRLNTAPPFRFGKLSLQRNLFAALRAWDQSRGAAPAAPLSIDLDVSYSIFGDDPAEIGGINLNNHFTDVPGLQALADQGCAIATGPAGAGGCNRVHATLPASVALNNGSNPDSLSFDQRGSGFPRQVGPQVDIGAYEAGVLAPPAPPKEVPTLGIWATFSLSLLLSLLGLRRRR